MNILLVDNYDSFTYNLFQYLAELGADVQVHRNDQIEVDEIRDLAPDGIVISPGPGIPAEAGISLPLIRELGMHIPILGVCLGHQAIGVAYGGRVSRAPVPIHGKSSAIEHSGTGVFQGLPSPFSATRYHSLVVERSNLPDHLKITAWTADGLIMGLRHQTLPVEGIQFHPESYTTAYGKELLHNFLARIIAPDLYSGTIP